MITLKPNTHKYRLYEYLNSGKSITTRNAMMNLGIADLQGTIRDLKEAGANIQTRDIKVPTRYQNQYGDTKFASVREYSLQTH